MLTQPVSHRDEWHHVVRKVCDGVVGLAVPHRRAIRSAGRVHQDRLLVAERETLIEACRGIALEACPQGLAVAALGDELPDRRHSVHAGPQPAIAGHAGVAELELELGRKGERNIDAIGRQEARGAIGPFDQHHRPVGQIIESKLGQLRGAGEPEQVGVDQRKLRQIVDLQQRESRAWHLDGSVMREIADKRPREARFTRPEVAGKGHEVARLQRICNVDGEPLRGVLVRQRNRKARCAGRRQEHRHCDCPTLICAVV